MQTPIQSELCDSYATSASQIARARPIVHRKTSQDMSTASTSIQRWYGRLPKVRTSQIIPLHFIRYVERLSFGVV